MKFMILAEMRTVTDALNFSRADCHVLGDCEIFTTKAAGDDKQLYRKIEAELEKENESHVRRCAVHGMAAQSDLTRATAFGPFSQSAPRRHFAHMIATLNAAHDDYDFSNQLRPEEFRKESLELAKHTIDSTLQSLRPHQTAAVYNSLTAFTTSPKGIASQVWNPRMWDLIDNEMDLELCEIFKWTPSSEPCEETVIESTHYLFYHQKKKRVCYLRFRCVSILSHSPSRSVVFTRRKDSATSRSSPFPAGEGAKKRAPYWLNHHLLERNLEIANYDADHIEDDEEMTAPDHGDLDYGDVPEWNLDDVRDRLSYGTFGYSNDDEMEEAVCFDDFMFDDSVEEAVPRHGSESSNWTAMDTDVDA